MTENSGIYFNIGFCGLLALVFITLKLTHYISWSWWWILSPIWIPILGALVIVGVASLVVLIMEKKWRH